MLHCFGTPKRQHHCLNDWISMKFLLRNKILSKKAQKTTLSTASRWKKKGGKPVNEETEGITYLDFETFMQSICVLNDCWKTTRMRINCMSFISTMVRRRPNRCGLKAFYTPEDMEGKQVVCRESQPRRARRCSEHDVAADNGQGGVRSLPLTGPLNRQVR